MATRCHGCLQARKAFERAAERFSSAMRNKARKTSESPDGHASGQYWSDIRGRWWPPKPKSRKM